PERSARAHAAGCDIILNCWAKMDDMEGICNVLPAMSDTTAARLDRALAEQVADKLTAHDALATHLRDELGMATHTAARPVQAALASAGAFAIGAALPLAMVPLSPAAYLSWSVSIAALVFLAILGGVGAKAGGAPMGKAIFRVTFWGAIAMAATAAIGSLFGTTIA
ncbi:MAG: VIT1/CCC1 transporter family protein, partial [Sphingorhabdus sp.]